jgi:hypothetical protein
MLAKVFFIRFGVLGLCQQNGKQLFTLLIFNLMNSIKKAFASLLFLVSIACLLLMIDVLFSTLNAKTIITIDTVAMFAFCLPVVASIVLSYRILTNKF